MLIVFWAKVIAIIALMLPVSLLLTFIVLFLVRVRDEKVNSNKKRDIDQR